MLQSTSCPPPPHHAPTLAWQVVGTTSQSTREQLEQLLRSSHIVSIHCPLTPATRGLIGERAADLIAAYVAA